MAEQFEGDRECSNSLIAVEQQQAAVRLTLRNPPANALSFDLVQALQAALNSLRKNPSVRVVIVAASGKLFSAGHDLKELAAHRADPDGGQAFFEHVFALCSGLMQTIVNYPKPVIAEVDGSATAAGCQLVASCDLALASDRSRFAVNGIDVGLFCATPAVALTRVINRKRAMEMLLTGAMIDAPTALEFGLINRVVASSALRESVDQLARTICAKSPVAIELGKAAVNGQMGMPLAQAYELASRAMVDNLMTRDAEEGIAAFVEHRNPRW